MSTNFYTGDHAGHFCHMSAGTVSKKIVSIGQMNYVLVCHRHVSESSANGQHFAVGI
jgi:hypothetical protein